MPGVGWLENADRHNQRVMDELRRTGGPPTLDGLRRSGAGVSSCCVGLLTTQAVDELPVRLVARVGIVLAVMAGWALLLRSLDRRREGG